jgi:cold shock CspA family protein
MPEAHPLNLPPVRGGPLLGHVASFDDPRGIGVVESGDRRFDFHCTAITDGSRHIDEGASVAFTVGPAHLGRLQASSVRPLGAVGAPLGSGSSGGLPG